MTEPEPVVVHTMLGARQVMLALQCLPSMKSMCDYPIHFAIHEDGTLDDDGRLQLTRLLTSCDFIGRQEAGQQVAEWLKNHPRCAKFRETHLFGIKLFDIPFFSKRRAIYCDTDILFTRPVKCDPYFLGTAHPFVAMQDLKESYAVSFSHWSILRKHGIRLASRVCAGMMSFERSVFDLDYVEWLLKIDEETGLFSGFDFWAEQTIYAALAAQAGCGWIEPSQCLVAHKVNFSRTRHAAIIHFAGFSRDLFPPFYEQLDPEIAKAPPLPLSAIDTPVCSVLRRLVSAAQTRLLYK